MQNLEVKYFHSGHIFMSTDSFHHQVELSLKKQSKVFYFDNFKKTVQTANSSKVDIKEMTLQDFFLWKDSSSKYKLQKIIPKPYLQKWCI